MSTKLNKRTDISKKQKQVKRFVEQLKAVPAMSHWKVYTSFVKQQVQLTYKRRGKRKARKEFAVIQQWCTDHKLLPEPYVLVLIT